MKVTNTQIVYFDNTLKPMYTIDTGLNFVAVDSDQLIQVELDDKRVGIIKPADAKKMFPAKPKA